MGVTFGLKLGQEICRAVGVDPATVIDVTLTIGVREPAQLRFTRFIRDDETNEIVTAIERYRLTPIDGEEDSR